MKNCYLDRISFGHAGRTNIIGQIQLIIIHVIMVHQCYYDQSAISLTNIPQQFYFSFQCFDGKVERLTADYFLFYRMSSLNSSNWIKKLAECESNLSWCFLLVVMLRVRLWKCAFKKSKSIQLPWMPMKIVKNKVH